MRHLQPPNPEGIFSTTLRMIWGLKHAYEIGMKLPATLQAHETSGRARLANAGRTQTRLSYVVDEF